MEHAITGNMAHLLAVMRAVKRFKKIVDSKRGRLMEGIFGRDSRMVAPPQALRTKSQETHNRHALDKILVTSGIHRDYSGDEKMPSAMEGLSLYQSPEVDVSSSLDRELGETQAHYKQRMETAKHHPSQDFDGMYPATRATTFPLDSRAKGQAHDPLEDTLFLNIGDNPEAPESNGDEDYPIVSESPPAVEMNIYEQAYQDEMDKILERRGREPSMYMTRRMEHRDDIRALSNIKDAGKYMARSAAAKFGGVSKQSYAAGQGVGDAGKTAARDAAEKFSEKWSSGSASASGYIEPWKQAAKDAASAGYGTASRTGEKLSEFYNKSGSGGSGGISSLVARAQAKYRGESSESTDGEPTPQRTSTATIQPSSDDQIDQSSAPSEPVDAQTEAPESAPTSDTPASEQPKDNSTEMPTGLPMKSAFKEHVT
jgi:hypothetical protein